MDEQDFVGVAKIKFTELAPWAKGKVLESIKKDEFVCDNSK